MPTPTKKLGWIGTGRMGYDMAARLAKGGCDITVWNRTAAKAQPLTEYGAKAAKELKDLSSRDIVFCMVSTWDDVKEAGRIVHELLDGMDLVGFPKTTRRNAARSSRPSSST